MRCGFMRLGGVAVAATLLWAAAFSFGADKPKKEKPEVNPYSPKAGLSPEQLRKYIEHMQDNSPALHDRPGFSEGMLEAADKILAAKPSADLRQFALLAEMEAIHQQASDGNDAADKRLAALIKPLCDDKDARVAKEARFYRLEARVLAADNLKPEELPKLLAEAKAALADQELDARHLRIASGVVHIINHLKDDDLATRSFAEFGEMFAKSDDAELSAYGRRVAAVKPEPSLVGKPLEIAGETLEGTKFNLSEFHGRVVLVDFWATWCGPCRAKLPGLLTLHDRFHKQGFEVVGVDLDTDLDVLGKFLDEQKLPWINLIGEKNGGQMKFPLAEKYGVAAIPTTFLIGRDGRVIVRDPSDEELAKRLEVLLKEPAKETEKPAEKKG